MNDILHKQNFRLFRQQSSLKSSSIVGVEAFSNYLLITTDKEVVQYHKPGRSIRRFTEADDLARRLKRDEGLPTWVVSGDG